MHLMLLFRSRGGDSVRLVASLRNIFLKRRGLEVIIIIVKPPGASKKKATLVQAGVFPRGCFSGWVVVAAVGLSIVGGAGEAFALYSHGGNVRSEHDFLGFCLMGGFLHAPMK